MTGHQHRAQTRRTVPPASDHRLDQFAAAVSEARETTSALAALGGMESQFIDAAMDIGAHLDRETLGAAWLIAGQLLSQHVQSVPSEQQASTLGALLNVLKLAGQRLYVGERLPVEMPCPFPYASGAPCKTVIKAPNEERLDTLIRAHLWQQHPDATWPPKGELPPPAWADDTTPEGRVLGFLNARSGRTSADKLSEINGRVLTEKDLRDLLAKLGVA